MSTASSLDQASPRSIPFSGVRDLTLRQFDVPNTLFEIVFSDPAEFLSTGDSYHATVDSGRRLRCRTRLHQAVK